ncbi:MAG: hypothetical protein VKJ06_06400 [Vampirovibrionales bacterium]|nr:hypothetical protein [Vampirovibrionales bacterium]
MAPAGHIERTVTQRYLEECSRAGYQPSSRNDAAVIHDSLMLLSYMNQSVLISRSKKMRASA